MNSTTHDTHSEPEDVSVSHRRGNVQSLCRDCQFTALLVEPDYLMSLKNQFSSGNDRYNLTAVPLLFLIFPADRSEILFE